MIGSPKVNAALQRLQSGAFASGFRRGFVRGSIVGVVVAAFLFLILLFGVSQHP